MTKSLISMVAVVGFSLSGVAAEFKVGVVNLQKAIQATSAGKKAKTELESDFEKKKKDLQKKEADLKKMQEDIEKKRSVLSEEVLIKKQEEFREEMMKFQQVVAKNQGEIQKKEQELTQPILDKMKKIVEKMSKDKGYSMVLENTAMVLYVDSSHDLTDDVVKAFEKEK
ncbi:MAG: OmpH family outer membrane protein [Bdellovibrionaceae bacterium]|nr:OmpH family outer membrane protein [Pseudobdellovibrionaceae bacterium]